MGLFDNLKKPAAQPAAPASSGNKTVEVVFAALPENAAQFKALPQAAMTSPFDTAALTVLALCFYPQDKDASLEMLDFLRGPRPLSTYDKQFIRDRFMDKDYVPRSYLRTASGICGSSLFWQASANPKAQTHGLKLKKKSSLGAAFFFCGKRRR